MKEKVSMRNAIAMHIRAIKELHSVTPKFFPVLTLYCIFSAITPYLTVFFRYEFLSLILLLSFFLLLNHLSWLLLSHLLIVPFKL